MIKNNGLYTMPHPYFLEEELGVRIPKTFYYVIIVGYTCVAFGFICHLFGGYNDNTGVISLN